MPLRLTITPAGQAACCHVPWYCVKPSIRFQRVLNGVVGRSEVAAEVGRVDRHFGSRLIVGAAATRRHGRTSANKAAPPEPSAVCTSPVRVGVRANPRG